ncbi:TPR repeat precursor [Nonlabens tegetincola]|uniref:TPR repeat n=1 Tax=Nonlabens tegetincola TaxID=323273 RepID=A0A090QQL7_9FLAO|nr:MULTISPECIES: tetratricopeptide repeat protein [Nonlabens]ALM21382.1 hypothetical protein AAT17_09145 [Nonlabens sp. MIC269]GAK97791.1 TPR repeat precursor [Nonlabens tegetincola]
MQRVLLLIVFLAAYTIQAQTDLLDAEALYKNKNYQEALVKYQNIYDKDSTQLIAIERLGDIAGHQKKYKKAMSYFEILVERDPKNANYHFKYGGAMAFYIKGISKFKAIKYLDDVKFHLHQAAILDKKHIESRHALSQMYCELPGIVGGSIKKAKFYADELLKISPVDGHLAFGFIYTYEEDYSKAEESYKKAIEVGGSPTTYLLLGQLYEKQELPLKALKIYKTGLDKTKSAQLQTALSQLNQKLN